MFDIRYSTHISMQGCIHPCRSHLSQFIKWEENWNFSPQKTLLLLLAEMCFIPLIPNLLPVPVSLIKQRMVPFQLQLHKCCLVAGKFLICHLLLEHMRAHNKDHILQIGEMKQNGFCGASDVSCLHQEKTRTENRTLEGRWMLTNTWERLAMKVLMRCSRKGGVYFADCTRKQKPSTRYVTRTPQSTRYPSCSLVLYHQPRKL